MARFIMKTKHIVLWRLSLDNISEYDNMHDDMHDTTSSNMLFKPINIAIVALNGKTNKSPNVSLVWLLNISVFH